MATNNKYEINELPCSDYTPKWLWWAYGLSVGAGVIRFFNQGIIFFILSIASQVCWLMFFLAFARGCRALGKNLSLSFQLLGIWPFLVLMFALLPLDTSVKLGAIAIVISLLIASYLYVAITLCRNFSGILGQIGKSMWQLIVMETSAIVCLWIMYHIFSSALMIVSLIIFLALVLAILYFSYKKINAPMDLLLYNGNVHELSDADFINYLKECGYYSGEINSRYASSYSSQSNYSSQREKEDTIVSVKTDTKSTVKVYGLISIILGVVIIVGVAIWMGINHTKKSNGYEDDEVEAYRAWDNDNEEVYADGRKEDSESGNSTRKYQISESSFISNENRKLPNWLSEEVLEGLNKEFLKSGTSAKINEYIFDSDIAEMGKPVRYNGFFNTYPIIAELSIEGGGRVTGRYAYKSTIDKYGDGPSSWFKLDGDVMFDGNIPYLVMRSFNPQNGDVFEYMALRLGRNSFDGELFNKKYLGTPTTKLYSITLRKY